MPIPYAAIKVALYMFRIGQPQRNKHTLNTLTTIKAIALDDMSYANQGVNVIISFNMHERSNCVSVKLKKDASVISEFHDHKHGVLLQKSSFKCGLSFAVENPISKEFNVLHG